MFEFRVAVHSALRDGEEVAMTVIGIEHCIFAEPRLTVVDILIGAFDIEADQLVATVSLADKLTGVLIEQATELNVGTTLVGDNLLVGFSHLALVLTMSIVILAATLQILYSHFSLSRIIKVASSHLRDEIGSRLLVFA